MITASILFIVLAALGTLIALAIRQKAIAYRDYYRDETALNELGLQGPKRSNLNLQAESARLRNAAVARRRVAHACVPQSRKLTHA